MAKEPVIRCPLCEWVPKVDSHWVCAPDEERAKAREQELEATH